MKIALAQMNCLVGNISSNEKTILKYITKAKKQKAQLLIFPEMALSGYPPLDLIYQKHLLQKIAIALKNIQKQVPKEMALLLGASGPGFPPGNSVFLLEKDKKTRIFSKEYLADYDVFDEKRYFKPGSLKDNFFNWKNLSIQILICEDLWQDPGNKNLWQDPANKNTFKNPDLIISLNASPFEINKQKKRIQKAKKWVKKADCPFIYVNTVGGQEELIFDGASFVLDKTGQLLKQSSFFKEDLMFFTFSSKKNPKKKARPILKKTLSKQQEIRDALIFGLKEFTYKNSFKKVHLGLSGGVDSALVALLACQALGEKKVKLFFLPGPFTSSLSEKCAFELSRRLKCPLVVQNIKTYYSQFLKTQNLNLKKSHIPSDITKQNIQARLRSLFLMAYANNEPESLLLGTSNKSELALGYSTLYGDLTGGLLPIGDLFKTEVYQLASYLKIPERVLKRQATAELKKNQKDEDDIPSYKILDPVLKLLIEKNQDPKTAFEKKIWQKILNSEFKRRQAPPILKIKSRSFDKGWRVPLSLIF